MLSYNIAYQLKNFKESYFLPPQKNFSPFLIDRKISFKGRFFKKIG